VPLVSADIPLTATTISGNVTGAANPVLMAAVRVKGSGEQAFSDANGAYALSGVEAGSRLVEVYAQGFKPQTQTVNAGPAGTTQQVNFTLVAA
jgi:hypothetical protein